MRTHKLNFHFMKIWYNVDFYFSLMCILDSTIPIASASFYIFVSSPDSSVSADKSSFLYSCHKVFKFAFSSGFSFCISFKELKNKVIPYSSSCPVLKEEN